MTTPATETQTPPVAPPPAAGTPPPATPPGAATTPADEAGKTTATDAGDALISGGEPKGQDAAAGEVELKLPEGVDASLVLLDDLKTLAKESGLKGEVAQKVVDHVLKVQDGLAAKTAEAWTAQKKQWVDAAKADKDFGGANFDASKALVAKTMQRFATPGFVEFLNKSGLENNNELFVMLAKVGKAISEDNATGTGGSTSSKKTEQAVLDALYPSMKAKE